MRKLLIVLLLLLLLPCKARALEFTAPTVPENAQELMPQQTESFAQGLWAVLTDALALVEPALAEASGVCLALLAAGLLTALVGNMPGAGKHVLRLVSALATAFLLLEPANTLIDLGSRTVRELSEYGKLLLPVMTAALAAQGGPTASAALYTGTAFFDAVLGSVIAGLVVPLIYVFLCLAVADSAAEESMLGKLRDFAKWLMTWLLKTVLYVFTGYMGLTGVISGTADALAVKAAKLTISGAVPVVGGILSDASEAVLVSAGVMKNAAGVYGLFAILAVFLGPFVRIGVQYLLLKLTAAVSTVYAPKQMAALIRDFSTAMGMLLAMTGTMCLLLMISTVCLMKGIN